MSARVRRYALLWHRYAGLFMAVFLAIAGLTGSILAFRDEIDRMVAPHLYATPRPGVPRLPLTTIAERARDLVPHATISGVNRTFDDQVAVQFTADRNPATGKRYDLGFKTLYVDPWTGAELGRRTGDNPAAGLQNLTSFILHLHDRLLTGPGYLFMGVVALVWTIDCFIAVYLTVPTMLRGFWRQWAPAWQIKRGAGAYRLNLDLHRAFGLWLWPMIFVFAWSSVMFNLRYPVFNFVMGSLFEYESQVDTMLALMDRAKGRENDPLPPVDWTFAETSGRALLEAKAREDGFTLKETSAVGYIPQLGVYAYGARTSRDINPNGTGSLTMFERNGEPLLVLVGRGQHTGNTIETWLASLHTTMGLGRWYQLFVAALGVVITMFSVTGVYLWWKKRKIRRKRTKQPLAAATAASARA